MFFLFRKDSDFSSVLYGVILLSRKSVTFILDLLCSSVLLNIEKKSKLMLEPKMIKMFL